MQIAKTKDSMNKYSNNQFKHQRLWQEIMITTLTKSMKITSVIATKMTAMSRLKKILGTHLQMECMVICLIILWSTMR